MSNGDRHMDFLAEPTAHVPLDPPTMSDRFASIDKHRAILTWLAGANLVLTVYVGWRLLRHAILTVWAGL